MQRWRTLSLLTLSSIVFLAGLFAMGELGRARLAEATREARAAIERRVLVSELRRKVAEAALASRNLLLTDHPEYAAPLRTAVEEIGVGADRLARSYGNHDDAGVVETARQLRHLAGVQTGAIMSLLSMYATGDGASARELARVQAPTTDPVLRFLEAAGKLENYEAAREQQARARWERQQQFYRNLGLAGLAANALLALGASMAAFTALRRHRAAMAQLARRRDQLEDEATARATELNDVYGHLQMLQEQERSRIARGLHDELGGLLLAARMDATWLRQHPGEADGRSRAARIDRIIEVLDRGIDLKRRVIEELRPTLLDNMGLTAAIRWQVDETCQRARLSYACHFPSEEPEVQPRAAIVLFRVAQEALNNIVKHAGATRVDVSIDVAGDDLLLVVRDDGRGIQPEQAARQLQPHGLAGMRHRLFALGGRLEVAPAREGGTEVRARVPRLAGHEVQRGVPASPAGGGSASSPSASESSQARTWRSASSADKP